MATQAAGPARAGRMITPPVGMPDGRLEQRAPRAVRRQRRGSHGHRDDGHRRRRGSRPVRAGPVPADRCPGGRDAGAVSGCDRDRRGGGPGHGHPQPLRAGDRRAHRGGLDARRARGRRAVHGDGHGALAGAAREACGGARAGVGRAWAGRSPLAVNRRVGCRAAASGSASVGRAGRPQRSVSPASTAPMGTPSRRSSTTRRTRRSSRAATVHHRRSTRARSRRSVEAALGGRCLFLQGTPGDIGPVETFVDELEPSRRLGTMLGHDAAAAALPVLRRTRIASASPQSQDRRPGSRSTSTSRRRRRTRRVRVVAPDRDDAGPAGHRRPGGAAPPATVASARSCRPRIERRRHAFEIRELRVRTKGASMRAERAEALAGARRRTRSRSTGTRIGPLAFIGVPLEPFIELGLAIEARRRSRRRSYPATRTATATTSRPRPSSPRRVRGRHLLVPARGGRHLRGDGGRGPSRAGGRGVTFRAPATGRGSRGRGRIGPRKRLGRPRRSSSVPPAPPPVGSHARRRPAPDRVLQLIFVLPVVQAFWYSLNNYDIMTGASRWVGSRYYERLLTDPEFWTGLRVAVTFTAIVLIVGLGLQLALAVVLTTMRSRHRTLLLTLFFLPAVLPNIAVILIWRAMYRVDFGLLDIAAVTLGVQPLPWLSDGTLGAPLDRDHHDLEVPRATGRSSSSPASTRSPTSSMRPLPSTAPGVSGRRSRSACRSSDRSSSSRSSPASSRCSSSSTRSTPSPTAGHRVRPRRSSSTSTTRASCARTSATRPR